MKCIKHPNILSFNNFEINEKTLENTDNIFEIIKDIFVRTV